MVSQAEKQAPAAPDRLRRDIDSGRTGDKVPVIDPAAAPLGTDDEAGGTRLSAQAARMAQSAEARRKPEPPKEGHMHIWYIGGIVVAALIIIAVFMTR
ncbi:MAG: hypothetical protein QOF19_1578 [Alphaproteobacteria bacterium]|nr:hypothetical protein [Alphaproteobacteria bacterium]